MYNKVHIYIIASASLGVSMAEDKEVQAALDAISAIDTLSLSELDERQVWLSEQLLSSRESEKQLKERLAQMQSDNDRLRDRVAYLEHELAEELRIWDSSSMKRN